MKVVVVGACTSGMTFAKAILSFLIFSAHDIAQDYCEHGIGRNVRLFKA